MPQVAWCAGSVRGAAHGNGCPVGGKRRRLARQTHPLRSFGREVLVSMDAAVRQALLKGVVIPAHPLALNAQRKLDERRQVALTQYYCEAGAGGIAVGVHTTQFA